MNHKAMALVEIVVSMLILAVAALAVTSTVSLVSSTHMRSAGQVTDGVATGAGSLDLQAAGYARETLELLKNAVSTNDTVRDPLLDISYPFPCRAAAGNPCSVLVDAHGNPTGTVYNQVADAVSHIRGNANLALPDNNGLVAAGGNRAYTVWDISSGLCPGGVCPSGASDVAYKKVKVCVAWPPETCA